MKRSIERPFRDLELSFSGGDRRVVDGRYGELSSGQKELLANGRYRSNQIGRDCKFHSSYFIESPDQGKRTVSVLSMSTQN